MERALQTMASSVSAMSCARLNYASGIQGTTERPRHIRFNAFSVDRAQSLLWETWIECFPRILGAPGNIPWNKEIRLSLPRLKHVEAYLMVHIDHEVEWLCARESQLSNHRLENGQLRRRGMRRLLTRAHARDIDLPTSRCPDLRTRKLHEVNGCR